ncbi:hypothetical protein J4462_03740 [Candidatus Pacearchaeota archaeon]|nr:hypothetical protein [Candidatus Pacearchaeota archaeon]
MQKQKSLTQKQKDKIWEEIRRQEEQIAIEDEHTLNGIIEEIRSLEIAEDGNV